MFRQIINWIKTHKLVSILLLVLTYLLLKDRFYSFNSFRMGQGTSEYVDTYTGIQTPMMKSVSSIALPNFTTGNGAAPAPDAKNRMVVSDSYLSLLVRKVAESMQNIKQIVQSSGGYMVESNINNPSENATGTFTVRVPSNKLDAVLSSLRTLAVKVVSENLQGTDVTDQYTDIEARIKILENNKARFSEIMAQAKEVSDILKIQQEIMNLQSQIDSYKGQQNYLAKTAEMAKITIYLATDEYSLPYAPAQPWRPEVIFKEAVRSMIGNLRQLGTLIIWIVVYSVIWLPIIGIIYLISKRKKAPAA